VCANTTIASTVAAVANGAVKRAIEPRSSAYNVMD